MRSTTGLTLVRCTWYRSVVCICTTCTRYTQQCTSGSRILKLPMNTQNSGICVVRFHGSSFPDRNSPPVKESPGTRSSSYICAGKALKGNVQEVQGSSFIHGDFNCSKNIVPGNSLLLQYFYAMSHKAKKKCTGTV